MKIRNFFLAALAILTLGAGPAFAQTSVILRKPDNSAAQVDIGAQVSPFKPTGNTTLAVTTSSARVALPSSAATDTTVVVRNTGANDASINLGNSSVTATTSNFLLPAGSTVVLSAVGSTNIAAITASSTTSLAISTGSGVPAFQSSGGGGTASAVTLKDSGGADMSDATNHAVKTNCVTGCSGSYAATVIATITRPADTNAYIANDTWADSTSAPTTGGFTLPNACSASGKSGVLVSLSVTSSVDPSVLLQGEIWLFDSAVTAVNDNAPFAISDSDVVKKVPGGVIPFALASTTSGSGTNSSYDTSSLNIGFTCSGSADLRLLVKTKNPYTPASSEVLTVRANVVSTN